MLLVSPSGKMDPSIASLFITGTSQSDIIQMSYERVEALAERPYDCPHHLIVVESSTAIHGGARWAKWLRARQRQSGAQVVLCAPLASHDGVLKANHAGDGIHCLYLSVETREESLREARSSLASGGLVIA
jgi:hypothetical protein